MVFLGSLKGVLSYLNELFFEYDYMISKIKRMI